MINDSNNSVTAGERGELALIGAKRPAAHCTHRPRHASRSGRRAAVAALLVFAVLGTALPAAAQSNNPPMFSAATADRSVAENTAAGENVGAILTATDADGDTLTYTLEGADAASFDLVTTSGSAQIRTKTGVTYNHEATASYTVIVKADDGNGGTDTITVTITVTDVTEPPVAVNDVAVVPVRRTTDSLTVSWSAPDNAGKPAITGYDVRYSDDGDTNWTTVRQDAPSTSVIITGLAPNEYYDVQVRAINADGSGPWSSTVEGAISPLSELVHTNHPLIPDDLGVGDSFRLLFVTTNMTAATGTGIHNYTDFVNAPALHIVEPGNLVNKWGEVNLAQTALLSLPGADARLLTDTTWTETDRGVPIYWLNGARVADDYADFYDGTWANEDKPRNGIGNPHSLADPAPWTGTDHDGTELFDGAASRAMGQATVGGGAPGSTVNNAGPLNGGASFASSEERPLYGLWQVMVVDTNRRLIRNYQQPRSGIDDTRAAVRAQLFTTGPQSNGYAIGHILIDRGFDTNAFLGPVAIYITDAEGEPDLVDGLHATLILERTEEYLWELAAPCSGPGSDRFLKAFKW